MSTELCGYFEALNHKGGDIIPIHLQQFGVRFMIAFLGCDPLSVLWRYSMLYGDESIHILNVFKYVIRLQYMYLNM